MAVTVELQEQVKSNPPPSAQAVRARALEYMSRAGMGNAELAQEVNYSKCSVTKFINGHYAGISDRDDYIRAALVAWMDAHPLPGASEDVPEKLILSWDTRLILERCEQARMQGQIVVLEGPAGTGKTCSLAWYAADRNKTRRDALYIRAFESITGGGLLRRIGETLGVPTQRTRERVLNSIVRKLRALRPAVILIDEAQRLVEHSIEPFETLRDLPDVARCGVVLAGHFNFLKAISNGMGRDLEQWLSRIDARDHLNGLQADELQRVAEEYFTVDSRVRGNDGLGAALALIREHAQAPDHNSFLRARLTGLKGNARYLSFRRLRKLFEHTQKLRALPGNEKASLGALLRAAAGQMMRPL